MQNDRPRKLQRISQACDLCHRRSIRCRPSSEDGDRCQNCYDFDVACTYDRPSKRRKHPQAPQAPREPNQSNHSSTTRNSITSTSQYFASEAGANNHVKEAEQQALLRTDETDELDISWKAFAFANRTTILELFDIYMEVVYPLYPLFHEATEKQRLYDNDYFSDRGFFASIMGACALASARVRDGALPKRMSESVSMAGSYSEMYYAAAKAALSADFSKSMKPDFVRAHTLLALVSIQYGQATNVQQYIGKALTLSAMQRFHDERHWPANITETQKEVYRRIYWCTYNLDVYCAVVWNCFMRTQEVHANVRYPSEFEEDSPRAPMESPDSYSGLCWLHGWTFTIDLYRVLEHTMNKARAKKFRHDDRRSVDNLFFKDDFSDKDVMQTMLNMYYDLPRQFKETPPMSGDPKKDIFAFQAANIQATLQLLRMILFSMEDGPGVERKCDVAGEVLSVFHTIPVRYLRAISTPLVYQLGSIGHVLGSVLEEPLSQEMYERVRQGLVSMADLLDTLESVLHHGAGASHGLRVQVDKIDQYMRSRRGMLQNVIVPPHPPQMSMTDLSGSLPMHNPLPDLQLPPEMTPDWPWMYFDQGAYSYPGPF